MNNAPKNVIENVKASIVNQLDQNGNGELDIADIIALAVQVPGIHVNRAVFLQKELFKNHTQDVIDAAISTTPALTGISSEEIDKIAEEVIRFERNCVSGISAALSAPGGWAMAATIPADIIQYYGYTLRATQKLLYLYGFPEIDNDENGLQLDTKTLNTIILCLGVMNGVAGANNAIKGMAKALAVGVEKQLMKKALTKGTLFPFVKGIVKWFNIKLTKAVFTGFFKKAIPLVGGAIGGGLTYLSFKPCCMRLKNTLQDTMLSNPKHISSESENAVYTSIINGELHDEMLNDSVDYEIYSEES
ncbi:MAG: hypothetical protein IJ418_11345 [Clostridia bacterium]|nr:hypothetical protein [Clostridia bacterium]